jgi:hypothetical protein
MRASVDDYHSLLARAVSALKNDTAEARQDLYERARIALKAEFGKLDPPPLDVEVLQERLKLDFAIHNFEWSMNAMNIRHCAAAPQSDRLLDLEGEAKFERALSRLELQEELADRSELSNEPVECNAYG